MSRKKAERRKRSEKGGNSPPPSSADSPVANPPVSPAELSEIRCVMDGLLRFFTGAKDKMEFYEIREKCRFSGMELNKDSVVEEKNTNISSRPFGTGENCSSRPFCT
jgi:hypothetical protein